MLPYDKKYPEFNAEITPFAYSLVADLFKTDKMKVLGCFINNSDLVKMDKDAFNKNLLVISDTSENITNISACLKEQTKDNERFIIIDTDNSIASQKYTAGTDFKIPLNTEALEFIYNECLADATADSKAMIKDIFKDLSDYSKTVSFVPFEALKSIIDDMVNKSHVFKLIVLKNKLEKIYKLGYFASSSEEAEKLDTILNSKNAVIDLSKLNSEFLNKYLEIIYSKIINIENAQVFVKMSNAVSKKTFKKMYMADSATIFAVSSNYKYLANVPALFKNFITEPSSVVKSIFANFRYILNSITADNMLIFGESTNYIPLVINPTANISDLLEQTENDYTEDIASELQDEYSENNNIKDTENEQNEADYSEEQQEILEDNDEDLNITEEPEATASDSIPQEEDEEEISFRDRNNDDFHTKVATIKAEILEQEVTENTKNEQDDNLEEKLEGETLEESKETRNENISEETDIETSDEDLEKQLSENTEDSNTEKQEDEEIVLIEQDNIDEELFESDNEPDAEIDVIPEYTSANNTTEAIEPEIISEEKEPETIIMDVLPIETADEELNTEEVAEIEDTNEENNDIVVEMDDDIIEDISNDEPLNQEILEDVDKVYTTIKDETISDDDLDLIDELNEINSEDIPPITSETEEDININTESLEELDESMLEQDDTEEFTEPLTEISDSTDNSGVLETKDSSTPIVPVFDAEIPPEDRVVSDAIEQGDTVTHAKYGTGVVEKMIKYGNKNLYSINFDNVGRRLLDPALTEIKKA